MLENKNHEIKLLPNFFWIFSISQSNFYQKKKFSEIDPFHYKSTYLKIKNYLGLTETLTAFPKISGNNANKGVCNRDIQNKEVWVIKMIIPAISGEKLTSGHAKL